MNKFWNKISNQEKKQIVDEAFEHPEKFPRELAWYITDLEVYYLLESSVYRILKSFDLITSSNHLVISASDKFKHSNSEVNEL